VTTAEKAATTSPLAPAADRLRESARWLVIAFGAVAAVVFTGIGIAGFGSLDPDTAPTQFWTALVGAGAALVGVLGALLVAMSLAAASTLTIAELCARPADESMRAVRTALKKDPILVPWGNDIGTFVAEMGQAEKAFDENQKVWATSTEIDPLKAFANRAAERLTRLGRVQTIVMETASYLRLRHRFATARWWIFGFLALAAAGATAFVWATGAAATESVPVRASAATWTVPDDDREIVGRQLGASCAYALDEVPVVILGEQGDGKEADIVTTAARACEPVRLVVGTGQLVRGR
jgi:uncharacterized membrane protein